MTGPLENARPCPFCGSKAEDLALMFTAGETMCFVRCEHCGGAGPDVDCDPAAMQLEADPTAELERRAVAQWNSRSWGLQFSLSDEDHARALGLAHAADANDIISDDDVVWFRGVIYRLLGEVLEHVDELDDRTRKAFTEWRDRLRVEPRTTISTQQRAWLRAVARRLEVRVPNPGEAKRSDLDEHPPRAVIEVPDVLRRLPLKPPGMGGGFKVF